jgi:hypothetical protein
MNSSWADNKSLKSQLHGLNNVRMKFWNQIFNFKYLMYF